MYINYKNNFLFEGKTKKIYNTDNLNEIIIHYKDIITSFDGDKKQILNQKGIINNKISAIMFNLINSFGIKTHFIRRINNREQLCNKLDLFTLEFVIRNIVFGSMSKRLGIKEGVYIQNPIFEIFYKNDFLKDPFINHDHAVFLKIISYEELNIINRISLDINKIIKKFLFDKNIILVDLKLEFGKNQEQDILLADEISPDTCRLWDKATNKKLDKDCFRIGYSNEEIINAYMEVLNKIDK
ncbi:phosphoribosylaminoimidazolesuccinocarboxamide synthase [Blattabacterium cuenoti]|uniref:phosphoribosylaminoimidazolesuccinocarboxamide synthase n=1 Tax=Blattabacterium cuenoti TaxID=1653831 RepID=UPI00163BEAA6|nr:phosphoribosylaminoimidazolesuccinocarboxamide synthase [Blattabacterium cuenoti]